MTNLKSISAGDTAFKIIYLILFPLILSSNLQAALVVKKISFTGNFSFKSEQLKKLLKTQEKKEFDNKFLRIDKIIISNFYLQNGFLNVWIETDISKQGDNIDLNFNIAEGRRFILGNIEFIGVQITSMKNLREFIKLKNGEFYQITKIEEGLNQIENFYFNNGKPYVEIFKEESRQDSIINLQINIKENETVYINDVHYIGLNTVKSFIIRRELKIGKGDVYSRKNIEKSQKSIYGTGLFDFVGIELKALENNRSQVLLMIKVVEKKSKWVGARFGVAYEQEIVYGGTFDFTLEFGHRNLFGTARSIYVDVVPSLSYDFNDKKLYNPKNQFSFTYVEPWIAYTKTPGIVRFSYYQVRPLNSADYDYYTSSFLVRHEFENFWKVSGMLAYNRVQILDEDSLSYEFFRQTEGQDYIYSITSSATRDRRDNYLNPQGGSLIDLNLRFAYAKSRSNETGEITDNRFIKTVVEWNRYQKFRYYRKWILATRLKAGNVIEFGKRSKIPVSERFFLGGASTVRGYREQLLGPIIYDEEGKNPRAVGGKLMFLANLEFRIPLFWLFWGEIFLDAGNVWIENDFLNIEDIKSSSGIGLALLTPLGPIRFDYGIKISPEENESKGEFHISISFAF